MSNKYGIPEDELKKIRARDKACVYCHKAMEEYSHAKGVSKDKATIEHLNKDGPFYWNKAIIFDSSTVAICCGSCNSSRGKKELLDWFKTQYCINRNRAINENTVTELVREYICTKKYLKTFTIDQLSNQLRQLIENSKWTFAKTMPGIPHCYIVKDNLSEADKEQFDELKWFIRKNGYAENFYPKQYKYFNINNYKYWLVGNILNRATT